jgi:hypothetical protein
MTDDKDRIGTQALIQSRILPDTGWLQRKKERPFQLDMEQNRLCLFGISFANVHDHL